MRNFISEDDIKHAILQKLEAKAFRYDIMRCDPSPSKREVLADDTGLGSKRSVISCRSCERR